MPTPMANETHRVSAAGQKKGIFGRQRAKAGRGILPNAHFQGEHFQDVLITKAFWIDAAGVSGSDRCYEPLKTQFVVAIPYPGATTLEVFDYELITNS
jgi:hypothetical protein